MRLPVYLYGHPVLRRQCDPVTPESLPDIKATVEQMFDTMYASEGVGLAGPQVGLPLRLAVIDADPVADTFPECAGRKFTLINPKVTVLDGPTVTRAEGCLSLPGLSENVPRVEHRLLEWTDLDGTPRSEEISGFLARIVQHECDHLDGNLYIDHIAMIRRQLIKSKLNNIITGRTRCDYPVRYAPRRR